MSNKTPLFASSTLSALLHEYVPQSRTCRVTVIGDAASNGLAGIAYREKLSLGTFNLRARPYRR